MNKLKQASSRKLECAQAKADAAKGTEAEKSSVVNRTCGSRSQHHEAEKAEVKNEVKVRENWMPISASKPKAEKYARQQAASAID